MKIQVLINRRIRQSKRSIIKEGPRAKQSLKRTMMTEGIRQTKRGIVKARPRDTRDFKQWLNFHSSWTPSHYEKGPGVLVFF
jgi:hypothetical protein